MSDYQGRTYYLQGVSYTVEKIIAEGKGVIALKVIRCGYIMWGVMKSRLTKLLPSSRAAKY